MKKIIVQIKDIQWYEENKDEHGIVYFDKEKDDTNFFSRGQVPFLGRVAEITHEDSSGNYRINLDDGEYIWKKEMFVSMEEKDCNDDIIDVDFKEDHEIISNDKEIHESIKSLQLEDKISFHSTTEKIKSIIDWNLNFTIGTIINLLISADEKNKTEYSNNIRTAIKFLQNELERIKQ
jgi:hypothetical protein